jgi:PDZ domain-containing protein
MEEIMSSTRATTPWIAGVVLCACATGPLPAETDSAADNVGGKVLVPAIERTLPWPGSTFWQRGSTREHDSHVAGLEIIGQRWAIVPYSSGTLEIHAESSVIFDPTQTAFTRLGLLLYHRPQGSHNRWEIVRHDESLFPGSTEVGTGWVPHVPANGGEVPYFAPDLRIQLGRRTIEILPPPSGRQDIVPNWGVDAVPFDDGVSVPCCGYTHVSATSAGIAESSPEFAVLVFAYTDLRSMTDDYDYSLRVACDGTFCRSYEGGAERAADESWGRWRVPWLGIRMQPVPDDLAAWLGIATGILVSSVDPDGPADLAGLRAGDVLSSLDGNPIGMSNFVDTLVAAGVGHVARLAVFRDSRVPFLIDVTLGQKPDQL